MKVCFSTLGCPEWDFSEILSVASDFKYDGIEIRGIASELYAPKIKNFLPENIEASKAALKSRGLEIPVLTSACLLSSSDASFLREGEEYISLAQKLGCKYVRLLGDKAPEPDPNVDDELVLKNLLYLSDRAKGTDVTLLVETNGVYAKSERLHRLITKASRSNIAVLWDIHHTYRLQGESFRQTYEILGPHIKHIHFKDSASVGGKTVYKVPGQGDLPVAELAAILKAGNYDGYISLEWVRRWNRELEEAGIVFAVYADYMRSIWNKA